MNPQWQQTLFAGADWRHVEDWPRSTRYGALTLAWLVFAVMLSLVLIRPAWAAMEASRTQTAGVSAKLSDHRLRVAELPELRDELAVLSRGRLNPLQPEQMLAPLRTDTVSALESAEQVQVSGRGHFRQLLRWLGQIGLGEPVLAEWNAMAITHAGAEGLEWDATLIPLKLQSKSLRDPSERVAHATHVGRDPFATVSVGGLSGHAVSSGTPGHRTLPSEGAWPPARVVDWPLDSLRFVGTIQRQGGVNDALLMAGANSVYRVRTGQVIATEKVTVRNVFERGVETTGGTLMLGPQNIRGL